MKKKLLLSVLSAVALLILVISIWLIHVLIYMPDVSVLKRYRPAAAAEALDINGRTITYFFDRSFRIWTPISLIPDHVVQAVITAEDDTFFEHRGVNFHATWDAFIHDVKKVRFARGGSTITQQMIKNVLLSREKTISRKIREIILARRAENILTKLQILEIYMNVVEWGDGIYGVEAASRYYFDKHAAELRLEEAALLAGMLPNPRYHDPFKRMDKARERQSRVLFNMFQAKLIDEGEYDSAVKAEIRLRNDLSGGPNPSFLQKADGRPCYQKTLEQVLLSRYGEHSLYREGLRIRTTIDKDLQDMFLSSHQSGDGVIVIRENGGIRAIACSDEDSVRTVLEYAGPPYDAYKLSAVSVESIRPEEVLADE